MSNWSRLNGQTQRNYITRNPKNKQMRFRVALYYAADDDTTISVCPNGVEMIMNVFVVVTMMYNASGVNINILIV